MTEDLLQRGLHDKIGLRLAGLGQRYTPLRRLLIETLAASAGPLTMPDILEASSLPQSSGYRNVTALIDAGVVCRISGSGDHGLFELSEEITGHHHHLVCHRCGAVEDMPPSQQLERALGEAARSIAEERTFTVTEHRVELVGLCGQCQAAR
jgi:Fur family ferric uptake transcriptional regulator